VFQIVFTKAFEYLDSITQPDRIQAWLVTTAKRESITLLRQGKGRVSIDGADDDDEHAEALTLVDPDPLPEQQLEALQMQRELRRALERLDPKTQEFARLLFLEDEPLPYSEIAARLGISEGSIGPMRARCLEKLRAAFAEKN
jgi:RNA polymerase sigma factor (sigma-70 family)